MTSPSPRSSSRRRFVVPRPGSPASACRHSPNGSTLSISRPACCPGAEGARASTPVSRPTWTRSCGPCRHSTVRSRRTASSSRASTMPGSASTRTWLRTAGRPLYGGKPTEVDIAAAAVWAQQVNPALGAIDRATVDQIHAYGLRPTCGPSTPESTCAGPSIRAWTASSPTTRRCFGHPSTRLTVGHRTALARWRPRSTQEDGAVAAPKKHPVEVRDRAIRLVQDLVADEEPPPSGSWCTWAGAELASSASCAACSGSADRRRRQPGRAAASASARSTGG